MWCARRGILVADCAAASTWRHGRGRSGGLDAAVVDDFGLEVVAAMSERLNSFVCGTEFASPAAYRCG